MNNSARAIRNLAEVRLSIDSEKLPDSNWKDGNVDLSFQNFRGKDVTQDTGDQIKYKNTDNPVPSTQIAELYFEQRLVDGSVRVKTGKD